MKDIFSTFGANSAWPCPLESRRAQLVDPAGGNGSGSHGGNSGGPITYSSAPWLHHGGSGGADGALALPAPPAGTGGGATAVGPRWY